MKTSNYSRWGGAAWDWLPPAALTWLDSQMADTAGQLGSLLSLRHPEAATLGASLNTLPLKTKEAEQVTRHLPSVMDVSCRSLNAPQVPTSLGKTWASLFYPPVSARTFHILFVAMVFAVIFSTSLFFDLKGPLYLYCKKGELTPLDLFLFPLCKISC